MNLHYQVSGPIDAPVIVLSHSLATNLSMWDSVASLLQTRFRVLRFDFRGHGESPAPAFPCTISDLVDDVVSLLDTLGIDSAYYVGLSLGGMVGLNVGLDRPERLLGLVVCDAGAETPAASRPNWDVRTAQVAANGMQSIVDQTLERWFGTPVRFDGEKMDRVRAMISGTSQEGYIYCAKAVQAFDVKHRLAEMTVPTLYLTGELDTSAPPHLVQDLQAVTPNARFLLIRDAGHLSAVDQPHAVAAAITDFVDGLLRTTKAGKRHA